MRLGLILLSIILALNGSSAGTARIDEIKEAISVQEKDETTQVVDLIKEYESNIGKAANTGDFSLLEPYLKPSSTAYASLKKQIGSFSNKAAKIKSVSHELGFLYYDGGSTYKAEIVETIINVKPDKSEISQDFQWIYTIEKNNGVFKISRMDKWKSYKEDVEFREMSAKSDGFYLYPVYEEYDQALIGLLNDQQTDRLDWLFKDSEAKVKHDAMLLSLKEKGRSFSLVKSEYLKHWNNSTSPYTAKKKITISYIDKNSCKKEMNLYLTLVIEVSRTRGKIFPDISTKAAGIEYEIK